MRLGEVMNEPTSVKYRALMDLDSNVWSTWLAVVQARGIKSDTVADATLFRSEAVQRVARSQKDPSTRDRRRRIALVAKIVHRQNIPLLSGLQHGNFPLPVGQEDLAVTCDRRRIEIIESFLGAPYLVHV